MKRNKHGQFVKGGKSKAKGAKRRAKGITARGSRGGSVAARLSRLEHGQKVLAGGLAVVARELAVHRRALVGGGLLSGRGAVAQLGG